MIFLAINTDSGNTIYVKNFDKEYFINHKNIIVLIRPEELFLNSDN